jgi:16S rRNA (guanine1207-N2)-methyltransferase
MNIRCNAPWKKNKAPYMSSRLSLAAQSGLFVLPETGRVAVFAPTIEADLSLFPQDRTDLIITHYPDAHAFTQAGWTVVQDAAGQYAMSVVCVPRAKAYARALIAVATSKTDGPVVVDGAKTEGADSLFKACRKLIDLPHAFSKAHGKTFVLPQDAAFEEWFEADPPADNGHGFVTRPGVFSAEKIDTGSAGLAAALPVTLGKHVIDLGAGWGYLSREILTRPDVETLSLVEADARALDCARRNINDDRASFHWDDATSHKSKVLADTVVTNPPFHTGRKGTPDLGKAFLKAAAALLKPNGQIFVVANRHLPYETTLQDLFKTGAELTGPAGFKILHARGPRRLR